jgi:bacillithiol biosynthesis cysteine-adding enzyme BshC
MQVSRIPLDQTGSFSGFFLDYISQKPALKDFYSHFPSAENLLAQLKIKQSAYSAGHRRTLTQALEKQYGSLPRTATLESNLTALASDHTFTITTGHQLNVFTGPLYVMYKIVTVINACRKLQALYPEYRFVPVYWMASEDHDYDEIKSVRLYGKKYTWHTHQSGAVGRFTTEGLTDLCAELPGDTSPFAEAYRTATSLTSAVRCYMNALFGDQGLVVLDGDDAELKRLLQPVMTSDLFHAGTLKQVRESNRALEEKGYDPQVFCRDINFFYLDDGVRGRIQPKGEGFEVVGTTMQFTVNELKQLVHEHPEKLSPNVILRPLYQEIILPNLAYTGGPAEVVYWLQLKALFDSHQIPFPVLLPRNFAALVEPSVHRKLEKTGMSVGDFFLEKARLLEKWVMQNTTHALGTEEERERVASMFHELHDRIVPVDKTLERFLAAQKARVLKSLETIEHKAVRAEKRKHKDKFGQLEFVKDALFPGGNPQERTDNMLNFYQRDRQFISKLIDSLDPFDFRFHILTYLPGEL